MVLQLIQIFDLDGNETTHRIEGLVAGETYILREIEDT